MANQLASHEGIRFLPRLPAYEQGLESGALVEQLLNGHESEEKAPNKLVTGDGDPGYGLLKPGQIELLWRHKPALKAILMLRSPLERAWLAVADALRIAQMAPSEASDQWLRDFLGSGFQRAQADYGEMLDVWYRAVPRDRLQLVLYDAMVSQPALVLGQAVDFLGLKATGLSPTVVGPDHAADLNKISRVCRRGFDHLTAADLEAHVRRVETLLDMDLPDWRKPIDVCRSAWCAQGG